MSNTSQVYRLTQNTTRGNTTRVVASGTLVTILASREDGESLVRLHPRKKTTWANSFSMPTNLLEAVQ